jgi:XRE family transcriptional regulator, regulator of sulfur utilization
METGDKIRILRTMKGFSQENMADMVGVSRLAYGDIERNKTRVSKIRLDKIAEVLGVSTEDIEALGDSVSNFFDQCKSVIAGVNNGGQTINNNDNKDLQHQIEKLQLENKLMQSEKEKAEIEAKY